MTSLDFAAPCATPPASGSHQPGMCGDVFQNRRGTSGGDVVWLVLLVVVIVLLVRYLNRRQSS